MSQDDFNSMVNAYTPLYSLNQRGGDLILSSAQVEIGRLKYLSDWAEAEVNAAVTEELVPDSLRNPEYRAVITRSQFAGLAVSLVEKAVNKSLSAAPGGTFADCTDSGVLKAYQAGIVNGVAEGAFDPDGVLSREQLATMLWRAVSYIQTETKKTELAKGGDLSAFTDAGSVSDWAREAVAALNANGIMKGTSETELSPSQLCSVEQSIVLAYRVFARICETEKLQTSQKAINSAYKRGDLYDGRDAVALVIDHPEDWKDVVGVSEVLDRNSYEEILVIPQEPGSLVEEYAIEYMEVAGGEYELVEKECLYREYAYDGYALLVRETQAENIPSRKIVVTAPDGRAVTYTLSYFRGERYYDFERFHYLEAE